MSVGAVASSRRAVTVPPKLPHRFLSLLITELVLIVGYPFTDGTALRAEMFRLFAVLVFSAALYAVLGRGRVTIFAFLLGVPAIVIHIANAAHYLLFLQSTSLVLGVSYLAFVTAIFIWTVVSAPSVTGDTLAGAVAAYLLVGITYGLAYGLIAHLNPDAFRDTVQAGKGFAPVGIYFLQFRDANHGRIWRHRSFGCACPVFGHPGICHRDHVSRRVDRSPHRVAQQQAQQSMSPSGARLRAAMENSIFIPGLSMAE